MNRKRWGPLSLSALLVTASASVHARTNDDGAVVVKTNFRGVDEGRVKRIEPALKQRASESLRLSGFDVAEESNITVVLHVRSVAEDPNPAAVVSDYGTHIEILIDGERVGDQVVTFCDQKGEAELVECALGGLEQALPLIPREETPAQDNRSAQKPPTGPGQSAPPPRRPGTTFIWGGAAATLAGTGALVTGAVLHVRKPTEDRVDPALGEGQFEEQHARKLTIPLMVGGSILVAGGVALMVIGARRNKKHKQRKTALLPSLTSGFSGLTLQGSF